MAKEKKEAKKEQSFWQSVKKFFAKVWHVIAGFCVRTYQDVVRVRWPNKKTIIAATSIVLSFIFLFGVYILFNDFIISHIFRVIY